MINQCVFAVSDRASITVEEEEQSTMTNQELTYELCGVGIPMLTSSLR
jgi:hypothetical protein